MSGRKPGEQVSKDGISTGVGGFKWNPLEDSVQIKVPNLFFAKKTGGRLSDDTIFFLF